MSKSAIWGLKSRPKHLQSHGINGIVPGIPTCAPPNHFTHYHKLIPSHSPMGWTGLSQGLSHVPPLGIPPNLVSCPIPQSHGSDGTVPGILTSGIYTPKSQCPVPSHSPMGWTGLSHRFSHVPPSGIPSNTSVLSHPTVPWDGQDCPRDCHMSHTQVYPQIPVSCPV